MGYYPDVNPGDKFKPIAKLENDVRHIVNGMNGFGGGVIQAGNPGVIRVPVYNSTSPAAVLQAGKAVSIDLSGVIAGDAYPAIAYSDSLPCYGVLMKDLNGGDCGTCILSGLASVQIASTPATGNYALPGTGGVFVRGDEGVPILNISGTKAVVMLGAAKIAGGGTGDHASNNSYGIVKTDAAVENQDDGVHPVPQDQVPMTQAVFEAIKAQYWKPNYARSSTVDICINENYVSPTSTYLFKPQTDGLFYIVFFPLYGYPDHEVELDVSVYSANPIGHPSIGPTETHKLYYACYENACCASLWYPALKNYWYYFYAKVHSDDQHMIYDIVKFYETQK